MAQIRLRVDHTLIPEDLEHFPLLVEVEDAALRGVEELAFVGGDGQPLPFQVEHLDPQAGRVRAWVGMARLSSRTDTLLNLVWGEALPVCPPMWDECWELVAAAGAIQVQREGQAAGGELTVEAWAESTEDRAEAWQVLAAQWPLRAKMGGFATWDAGETGGLRTKGFFGAVRAGRYIYFVPQFDGEERHGKVLRYDSHGEFADAQSWAAYDAGHTSGLNTKGYYGGVYDGCYVYFVPRLDGVNHHSRVLRHDPRLSFTDPASWQAFDAGLPVSYQGAAFDGRYIYFVPGYHAGQPSGKVLRYDTQGAFGAKTSYAVYDAGQTGGLETRCYDGAVFDGRYVYFVPLDNHGNVLRYDTHGLFGEVTSWAAYHPQLEPALGPGVGAIFDGRYVYFTPYAGSAVVRLDSWGVFDDPQNWRSYEVNPTSGLKICGYDGAAFDGRYVYFIPFWEGEDVKSGFHARLLRCDTRADFDRAEAWQVVEAGATEPPNPGGFNAGAFDGRYLYLAPWREDCAEEGRILSHGKVLRVDTAGEGARFVLKYMDCGHNGGLGAALPGPSFLVNTEQGPRSVQAHALPEPGWHHLAGVWDGQEVSLYVDGVLIAREEGSGKLVSSEAGVDLGQAEGGGGAFRGTLALVRVCSRARSAAWLYAAHLNLRDPGSLVRPAS